MNATTHQFLPEEVMTFLDGELLPERCTVISAHLNECANCSAVAANFRSLSNQLAAWRVQQVTAGIDQAAGVQEFKSVRVRPPSSLFKWVVTAGSTVIAVLLLMTLALPNLLRSKIAANESSAVGSLRTLNTAAVTYLGTYGHYPSSLKSFGPPTSGKPNEEGADLVDMALASGRKSGYLFNYRSYPSLGSLGVGTYVIQADPLDPKYGIRHFSTDQTGVLFANGMELGGSMPSARVSVLKAEGKGQGTRANTSGAEVNLQEHGKNPTSLIPDQPMIARTVALSIVVKDFDAGRTSLDAILTRHQGYAASLSVSTPQEAARTLQASLRIPAPQVATALSELKALGRAENETQNGEEVTQQHADLVARIKNNRETEVRLQDILEKRTGKVKDVLEVEQEIARVRGEIEQMEAAQKTLEHRVEFATIDLKLAEEYKAQLNTPAPSVFMQLRNAAVNGFRNAFESLLALVLFLAESGPSLLLWLALLGIPAWRLWRRYRRAQSLGSLAGA